jgi:hypothetical protein
MYVPQTPHSVVVQHGKIYIAIDAQHLVVIQLFDDHAMAPGQMQ